MVRYELAFPKYPFFVLSLLFPSFVYIVAFDFLDVVLTNIIVVIALAVVIVLVDVFVAIVVFVVVDFV